MDWDKIRIFHVVAEAGSFTKAADALNLTQSSVSRQVSTLEQSLKVSLFHRHARGLILTEQGELLYRTAHDVFNKLRTTETKLADAAEKPFGQLRVTASVGFGGVWLTPRLNTFIDLYPDIQLQILLSDTPLDLSMREADIAIWLAAPTQSDLIRRPMFTVHFHVYGNHNYFKKYGMPESLDDLVNHRILTFGGQAPYDIKQLNWLETAGLKPSEKRKPVMTSNNLYSLRQAVKQGMGLAVLPDYLARDDNDMVAVLKDESVPTIDTYFVYPEELRNSKRINVFRDYLMAESKAWSF